MVMATDKIIKQQIPNLSLTSSGLTTERCSIVSGGYATFGNIVFVNMRVSLSSTAASITGLPKPIQQSYNTIGFACYDGQNEKASFGYIDNNGVLRIPGAYGSTGILLISMSYLAMQ